MKLLHIEFLDIYKNDINKPIFIEYDFNQYEHKGHYNIGFEIFPLKKQDMKTLFNGLLPEAQAHELAEFFTAYLDYIERYYSGCKDGKLNSRAETEKKRFIAMLEALHEMYESVELYTPKNEIVKTKKAEFYTQWNNEAVKKEGVRFIKAGIELGAYCYRPDSKFIYIIDLASGAGIKSYHGALKNAPCYLTEADIDNFLRVKNGWKYKEAVANFRKSFTNQGLSIPDYVGEPDNIEAEEAEAATDALGQDNTEAEPQTSEHETVSNSEEPQTAKQPQQARQKPPHIFYIYTRGIYKPKKRLKNRLNHKSIHLYRLNRKKLYKTILQATEPQKSTTARGHKVRAKTGKSPPNLSEPYKKI